MTCKAVSPTSIFNTIDYGVGSLSTEYTISNAGVGFDSDFGTASMTTGAVTIYVNGVKSGESVPEHLIGDAPKIRRGVAGLMDMGQAGIRVIKKYDEDA